MNWYPPALLTALQVAAGAFFDFLRLMPQIWVFFSFLRLLPQPGAALAVKAYIWRVYGFSHFSCKIHSLKGVLFPSFPLKLEIEIQISISKLLPEGSGFHRKIQIQTRLINAIWGPKSENSARMPIAYCLLVYSLLPIGLQPFLVEYLLGPTGLEAFGSVSCQRNIAIVCTPSLA